MNQSLSTKILQGILALVAALFGAATIIAGTRVLAGSDPGYIVFRPLLIYNTAMGAAYVAAGILMWRSVERGLYALGGAVAIESFGAMTLRTVVWLVLFLLLKRMVRANNAA